MKKIIRKMLKVIVIIVIVTIIIAPFAYFIPLKRTINTKLDGVECRIGSNEYTKNVSISINGVYKNYLIKDDRFEGTIKIDGYDFTKKGKVFLVFQKHDDNYEYLDYDWETGGLPDGKQLGLISCTPYFKKVLVILNYHYESKNILFISAPSKNRKDAIEAAKEFSAKSKWFSKAKWTYE